MTHLLQNQKHLTLCNRWWYILLSRLLLQGAIIPGRPSNFNKCKNFHNYTHGQRLTIQNNHQKQPPPLNVIQLSISAQSEKRTTTMKFTTWMATIRSALNWYNFKTWTMWYPWTIIERQHTPSGRASIGHATATRSSPEKQLRNQSPHRPIHPSTREPLRQHPFRPLSPFYFLLHFSFFLFLTPLTLSPFFARYAVITNRKQDC